MYPAPRKPTRGNWTWLVAGIVAATVLTGAALHFAGRGCRAAAAAAASGPAGRATAAPGGAGVPTPTPAPAPVPARTPAPALTPGLAVYYNPGKAAGSCSLGPFRPGGDYVSLPPGQYDGGAKCGSYLDVHGPGGSVRAEVVDLCPGCAATTINLSRAAFDRIGNPVPGSATVTYRQADDPPLPGPLLVRVGAGTASGQLALQILHHGNPLASVAIAPAGTAAGGAGWHSLTLTAHDYWVDHAAPPAGPAALRITDTLGHRVILARVALRPATVVRSATWMYQGTAAAPAGTVTAASPQPPGASTPATAPRTAAASTASPSPAGC